MKFKLFSAVLLLVCFVFLGVISGAIPVTELDLDEAAGLFSALAVRDAPSPAPAAAQDTPAPKAGAGDTAPTDGPEDTPKPLSLPQARTASTAGPVPTQNVTPTVTPTGTPEPTAEPTPEPEPTAEPAPEPEPPAVPEAAAEQDVSLWEPAVEVISTTITWNDPLQNDTSYQVDGAALLRQSPSITLPAEGYQILIIHTHGTEAFTPDGEDQYEASGDYRTTDTDHSIIRVGRALGKALESYGLRVLVDDGLYDWPNYDEAYGRSAGAIQSYLEANPGIAMVIDLHRDALGDDQAIYKTVSDQVQPDAAQLMFVVGTDTNLAHPTWRENLRFAMSLQGLVEEKYPHLMRPTLLCPYRYNQQLCPGSVLLEVGTAGNTLQEAITAAELFAEAAGPVLAAQVGA